MFERLAPASEGTGTGVGLAILRRIAESCGGTAWIEERIGGGARLVIELAKEKTDMTTDKPRFVILLAEDEPADAHLVKVAIADGMAELHHVLDGREALDYLQRLGPRYAGAPRPDLILLDLNMPRLDGREFLAAIKQLPDLRDIPVVVLTTSEVERDVVAAYDLGAAGYITKPMSRSSWPPFGLWATTGSTWFACPKAMAMAAKLTVTQTP